MKMIRGYIHFYMNMPTFSVPFFFLFKKPISSAMLVCDILMHPFKITFK